MKLDRRRMNLVFFGVFLLVLAAFVSSNLTDVRVSFWSLAVYALIFGVLILVLSRLPGKLVVVLSWVISIGFSIWLVALLAQIITASRFTPYLATAQCMVQPFDERCVFNRAAVALAQPAPAPAPSDAVPAPQADTSLGAGDGQSAALEPLTRGLTASVVPGVNQVYIQFAVLSRDDVVSLAMQLVGFGWSVQGADAGGERLAAADGLMEVRFFYPDDQPRAELLAQNVSQSRPGNPPVAVRDLSGSGLAGSVPPGHFELWISR